MPNVVVHAVAALTAGYRAFDATAEERNRSASALQSLITGWLNPEAAQLLGPVDYHYLEVSATQMLGDPAYLEATGQAGPKAAQSA
jgi:hypothetical protein